MDCSHYFSSCTSLLRPPPDDNEHSRVSCPHSAPPRVRLVLNNGSQSYYLFIYFSSSMQYGHVRGSEAANAMVPRQQRALAAVQTQMVRPTLHAHMSALSLFQCKQGSHRNLTFRLRLRRHQCLPLHGVSTATTRVWYVSHEPSLATSHASQTHLIAPCSHKFVLSPPNFSPPVHPAPRSGNPQVEMVQLLAAAPMEAVLPCR